MTATETSCFQVEKSIIVGNCISANKPFSSIVEDSLKLEFYSSNSSDSSDESSMIPGQLFRISKFLFVLFSNNFHCLKLSFLKTKWRRYYRGLVGIKMCKVFLSQFLLILSGTLQPFQRDSRDISKILPNMSLLLKNFRKLEEKSYCPLNTLK